MCVEWDGKLGTEETTGVVVTTRDRAWPVIRAKGPSPWIFKIVLLPVGGVSLVSRRFRAASYRPCAIHLRLEIFSQPRGQKFFFLKLTISRLHQLVLATPTILDQFCAWPHVNIYDYDCIWNARDSPTTHCLFWFPCVYMLQSNSQVAAWSTV